jgi:glucosamine--fructose-6-phosphate aminotransferase (isomerizing)
MCGIFGYVGSRRALPLLIEGLERLEYRGYDSAGIVVLQEGGFFHEKCAGKVETLKSRLASANGEFQPIGIGHTRWATHGAPTSENAHPHFSCDRRIALVHNGIIENHAELRDELAAHTFKSQTDTEVMVHLIEERYQGVPVAAVRDAVRRIRGSFALVVMFADRPDQLVAARRASPLIVGVKDGERFIASDIPAILPYTNEFELVEDGQIVELSRDGVRLFDFDLNPRQGRKTVVHLRHDEAQKHGFPHFMLKEIHEQPQVVQRELSGRIRGSSVAFDELTLGDAALGRVRRLAISACGTAWHAALYAKYAIEALARLPVDVWLSSEIRYSPPPLGRGSLLVALSQSGETADTLQALHVARKAGVPSIGITNTPPSTLAREADAVIYNRAGIEVGVAATKTYLSQLASLLLLAAKLGRQRRALSNRAAGKLLCGAAELPAKIEEILRHGPSIQACASRYSKGFDFMYIGRRYNVATAYEGALKMKEISYLHAEGYAAGEMKHGPLALVDARLATLAIAPRGETYEKLASNIQEIRARNGRVISVVSKGDGAVRRLSDEVFEVPETDEILSPLTAVVPLQLMAYHTATALGRDVDKPRNLAKSVTVE